MYPSDYIFILLRYKLTENVTLAELKSVQNIYHFCKRSWTSTFAINFKPLQISGCIVKWSLFSEKSMTILYLYPWSTNILKLSGKLRSRTHNGKFVFSSFLPSSFPPSLISAVHTSYLPLAQLRLGKNGGQLNQEISFVDLWLTSNFKAR